MPSSTSSSDPRRTRRHVAHLAIGVAAAVVATVAVALTAPAATRRMEIVASRLPPNDDYYLAHDRGGHVDHHVLYHGIDREALNRLRAAQVLFLGNSRLMFALDTGALRAFFGARGLTYYVMGFGHTEQDDFPARIIAKHDLRPAVVVVNADGFFWDDESEWASRTVRESSFDAWKLQFESEAAHRVRRRLHAIVPQYVDLRAEGREFIAYRSRLDGTWFVANQFDEEFAFDWPPGDRAEPSRRSLHSAEAFKKDLDARGIRLILCLVPSPQSSLHRAQVVADHLGVPLVAPVVDRLATVDRSHLTAASAWRFERAFLAALAELLPQAHDAGRAAPVPR